MLSQELNFYACRCRNITGNRLGNQNICLSVCLSVCRSGLQDTKLIHYRVVNSSSPDIGLDIPRLCPLSIRCLCFPFDDDAVPSFPPLRDSSGLLALTVISCPSPHSFLPIFPLSARFCVFRQPPPVSGPPHRPSPIVRPSESYQPSGFGRPMSSSGFLTQRPICRFEPPPDLCGWWYLAWVWVEGRSRRRPPRWS